MTKKRWVALVIACAVLLAVLFAPVPYGPFMDGGTREYRALTYTLVKWHKITSQEPGVPPQYFIDEYGDTAVFWFPDNFKSNDELWELHWERRMMEREPEIEEWPPSVLYSDEDIHAAIEVVKETFSDKYEDCILLNIAYREEKQAAYYTSYAETYGGDEAIALYTDFYVTSQCTSDGLEPRTAREDFGWILVRDNGGEWRYANGGYID